MCLHTLKNCFASFSGERLGKHNVIENHVNQFLEKKQIWFWTILNITVDCFLIGIFPRMFFLMFPLTELFQCNFCKRWCRTLHCWKIWGKMGCFVPDWIVFFLFVCRIWSKIQIPPTERTSCTHALFRQVQDLSVGQNGHGSTNRQPTPGSRPTGAVTMYKTAFHVPDLAQGQICVFGVVFSSCYWFPLFADAF